MIGKRVKVRRGEGARKVREEGEGCEGVREVREEGKGGEG